MPSNLVTAGSIMDLSAARLNDVDKENYTYEVQLPFLKIALKELEEIYQENSIPVTETTSDEIEVEAGVTEIGFDTTPALPSNLVEIIQLWERNHGINPYIPVDRKDLIPHTLQGIETSQFGIWSWESNKIKLLAANQDNDLKIDYIKQLFSSVISEATPIHVINCTSFLLNRTAALCASDIGQNSTKALELNSNAESALERALGISIKGKQSILTRRMPFRIGWKSRINIR